MQSVSQDCGTQLESMQAPALALQGTKQTDLQYALEARDHRVLQAMTRGPAAVTNKEEFKSGSL